MVVPLLQWGKAWRGPLIAAMGAGAIIGAAAFGGKIANLGRVCTVGCIGRRRSIGWFVRSRASLGSQ
jgi:hypothetical protein